VHGDDTGGGSNGTGTGTGTGDGEVGGKTAPNDKQKYFVAVRTAMRKGMKALTSFWSIVSPILLFGACSSQNSYQTLRLALAYGAPDPFSVTVVDRHEQVLSEDEVQAQCCVRLYVKAGAEHFSGVDVKDSILQSGERALAQKKRDMSFHSQLCTLQDDVFDFLAVNSIASPIEVGFKTTAAIHVHGSSLVLVYGSHLEATTGKEFLTATVRFHHLVTEVGLDICCQH
jgi:hypothetical protein